MPLHPPQPHNRGILRDPWDRPVARAVAAKPKPKQKPKPKPIKPPRPVPAWRKEPGNGEQA
jgi:hypothetical protein